MNRDPVRMSEDISLPEVLREDLERWALATPAFDIERGLRRLQAAVEAEEEPHEAAERVVQASPTSSWMPAISAQDAPPAERAKDGRKRFFYACQAASVSLLVAIGVWGSFALSSAASKIPIAQPLSSISYEASASQLALSTPVAPEPPHPRTHKGGEPVVFSAPIQDISVGSAKVGPRQKPSQGMYRERPKASARGAALPNRSVFESTALLGDDSAAPPPCRFSTQGCGSEEPEPPASLSNSGAIHREFPKSTTASRQICGKLIRLNCTRKASTVD